MYKNKFIIQMIETDMAMTEKSNTWTEGTSRAKSTTTLIEGNIIYVVAIGEQTTEIALKQCETNSEIAQLIDGKVNYLINLNKSGKSSPEARKIWKSIIDEESSNKIALFGLHPVARVLASFVMNLTSSKNVRFFNTYEESVAWLKSN